MNTLNMRKIFYNASLPRSGSTLLQNVLAQNPDIYATPTSGLSILIQSAKQTFSTQPEFAALNKDLMKKAFLGFLRGGLEGFALNLSDKKYLLDKSFNWGGDYYLLKYIFNGESPKIIIMVRDLRETIASMEEQYRFNPQHTYPKVDKETTQLTTLEKRLKYWSVSNPFGLTLDFLKEIFSAKIEDEIFFVKFEDFCRFPEPIMKSLYKYLEIPYFSHDFDNVIQVTDQNDAYYIFNHKIRKQVRPVEPKAVDIMGIEACNWVYENYEWFFKKFNYEK